MSATATPEHHKRIANMVFASLYPHYVTKVEKKGRTEEELHHVIHWLTGMDKWWKNWPGERRWRRPRARNNSNSMPLYFN